MPCQDEVKELDSVTADHLGNKSVYHIDMISKCFTASPLALIMLLLQYNPFTYLTRNNEATAQNASLNVQDLDFQE